MKLSLYQSSIYILKYFVSLSVILVTVSRFRIVSIHKNFSFVSRMLQSQKLRSYSNLLISEIENLIQRKWNADYFQKIMSSKLYPTMNNPCNINVYHSVLLGILSLVCKIIPPRICDLYLTGFKYPQGFHMGSSTFHLQCRLILPQSEYIISYWHI